MQGRQENQITAIDDQLNILVETLKGTRCHGRMGQGGSKTLILLLLRPLWTVSVWPKDEEKGKLDRKLTRSGKLVE